MNKQILSFLLAILTLSATAQTRVDSNFDFQTVMGKKYSLYIPTSYNSANANKMMVAFHPFNTTRWDAKAWCDTLTAFAEMNGLILVCPDGDADGNITDQIDYDFTTALIDSVAKWYNINDKKTYAMGFSMGGLATYEYGLKNHTKFGGYIPIGAATNGTTSFSSDLPNAANKAFYLVHGNNDAPANRFTPVLTGLNNNNAITEDTLMPGVGHTIDFTDRNEILSRAFRWIDSVNSAQLSVESTSKNTTRLTVYPNIIQLGSSIHLLVPTTSNDIEYTLFNSAGQKIFAVEKARFTSGDKTTITITPKALTPGNYIVRIIADGQKATAKFIIQ